MEYSFATSKENFARVFKTTNYIFGFLFSDYFQEKNWFNGTEWTAVYHAERI